MELHYQVLQTHSIHTNLIYKKVDKAVQWRKDSINSFESTGYTHGKILNLDHYLTPHTRTNSRWILDLNVKGKTVRILGKSFRKNYRAYFQNHRVKWRFHKTQKALEKKAKKWYKGILINCKILRPFVHQDTTERVKRQPKNW